MLPIIMFRESKLSQYLAESVESAVLLKLAAEPEVVVAV